MTGAESEITEFISNRLFTEIKPVLFQDLIYKFKMGPSRAKGLMYEYYKQNTNAKFNCTLMCCYSNGLIKVIQDINAVNDSDASIEDCFIYALNPLVEFIPVNKAIDQTGCLSIKNPYVLKGGVPTMERPQTTGSYTSVKREIGTSSFQRSKTVPSDSKTAAAAVKIKPAKEMGLRSTAILAKMRKEREEKEKERQMELQKRREAKKEQHTVSDPMREAQLQELNSMFDEEDGDIDMHDVKSESEPPKVKEEPVLIPVPSPIKKEEEHKEANNNLEDLLETTAEDSLMELGKASSPKKEAQEQEPEEESSYVDEDGYIVTSRSVTKPVPLPKTAKREAKHPKAVTAFVQKKKQKTLENFFKKSSK